MDSAETRFAHLLQPIRELTKNWDVDVASELADYLEEVTWMAGYYLGFVVIAIWAYSGGTRCYHVCIITSWLFQLDEMCITFDGGKTTLNFAEAALLIQGSTCIYSKKVIQLTRVGHSSHSSHQLSYIQSKSPLCGIMVASDVLVLTISHVPGGAPV